MAHTSATCLPFPSLLSSFLSIMNKDKEEEEVPFSFIEGQIDDSQTAAEASQAAVESCYSLDSHRLLHKSTTTNNTMLPSLPSSTSIAEEESGPRGLRLTSSNKSQKVVKKNMSSSLNSQVTIISFLLLIASLSLPCPCHGLELKPPTAEKEVFTGDSFVVTCLTDSPSSSDLKLSWLAPDGREVASVPTAPIYVSEKPDGLQIVFLRHAKKHSGRYMCVQRRAETGEKVDEIPFSVTIYKSIEFVGPSSAVASEGDVFSVLCNAKFDPDVTSASVVWDKTGRNIINEDSNKYFVSETKPPNLKSTLNIRGVEKGDAGQYTCRATQFTQTISQFKQHDIYVRVQYKPKFPPNTPGDVWIDRERIMSGIIEMEINFTCIVDADPPAIVSWYDTNGRSIRTDQRNVNPDILGLSENENMSVLRYRYKVNEPGSGMAHNSGGMWPPAGVNQYERPSGRRDSIEQPNVQYECRSKNELGSANQVFRLKIGDLPSSPTLVDIQDSGNNLTLVLFQPEVEPPVDFYRIELSDGVTVRFNSSSLVPDANDVELSGSSYDTTSNNWNQGRPGDIPPVPTGKNATYFVSLDNVPSGRHRMIIYAHNGVGWSQALKDPSLVVQVVNQGSMTRTSTFTFLVSSFLLSGLLTILWNNH